MKNFKNFPYWEDTPLLKLHPVKQRLLTIALDSISMNLCLPNWKSRNLILLENGYPVCSVCICACVCMC